MQASARTCGISAADRMSHNVGQSQIISIYFNHPSQGNSANYYIILESQRQGCASSKSTNRSFLSKTSELSTPSSIFINISSSSTGELSFARNQSEARFAEMGEYSHSRLSEAFWTPNIASSHLVELPEAGSRSKRSPN